MMSFHWMFIAKCMSQFLEWLNAAHCTDGFLSGQEINQYAPHCIQENFPQFFPAEGMVLVFLFFGEAV
jgi:hypothetical protein